MCSKIKRCLITQSVRKESAQSDIPVKRKIPKTIRKYHFHDKCDFLIGPPFIRGDPVGRSRKEKILTKIGGQLDMLQATFWLFFCWDILVSTRYEVGRKKFGKKV